MTKIFKCSALITGLAALAFGGSIQADEYPNERLDIILSHSLGGGQDRLTRALARTWEKHLGTEIRVVPADGASGRIGYDRFLREEGNGYTALSANIGTTSIMYADQKPDWRWSEDIYDVTTFGIDPGVFFVHTDSPFQTVEEVFEAAMEDSLTVAINRWGSVENIQVHQLMDQTGAKFEPVDAGGGSAIVTLILGQHADVGFGKISSVEQAGDRVRYLAVATKRNPAPGLTNNAPPVDEVMGTDTVETASYRAIAVHREFKEKHPEAYAHFEQSLLATKEDPEYIEAAAEEGVHPDLISDLTHEDLRAVVENYWAVYEDYSHVFN